MGSTPGRSGYAIVLQIFRYFQSNRSCDRSRNRVCQRSAVGGTGAGANSDPNLEDSFLIAANAVFLRGGLPKQPKSIF